ncbi:hypothetical protein GCM10010172_06930 [Paractinoplanes ferrugineus]|uniref:Uncharacterized protein n=1 Tax=Paractinoplanes ferrugineus TaxID=113564 RepID=A0A919MIQ5_9ACTN|nr:hypothetical protein [Actinoplanes ferrugineus]GIE16279.1 hypothetical protein Afe05nite_81190 [Actinoplanes ferrugineus]
MTCPRWCTRHDDQRHLHCSGRIRVGPEPRHTGRGQVFAWLQQSAHSAESPLWVGVGAAHMASATVEISVGDAAMFWRQLGTLLETAGVDPVTGQNVE